MGKKGGKKAKLTGTPDVIKFKQTREFELLKEILHAKNDSFPYVSADALDDVRYRKVGRFLTMVGLLAEHLCLHSQKDHRFKFYHEYLAPMPQYYPSGFDIDVIRGARELGESTTVVYNGVEYTYPEELQAHSIVFLQDVDKYVSLIHELIEKTVQADFQEKGLKAFKVALKELIEKLDQSWVGFEVEYVKMRHSIHGQVYEAIGHIVTTEAALTRAEDRMDVNAKEELQNTLVMNLEAFANTIFPDTKSESFPEDVICLAESCIFHETKCAEEWLHLAKYLIKDYLGLRTYITRIPEERLRPDFIKNKELCRLVLDFHASVIAARKGLDFAAKQPKLTCAKTENFLTARLLAPDLKRIQRIVDLTRKEKDGRLELNE